MRKTGTWIALMGALVLLCAAAVVLIHRSGADAVTAEIYQSGKLLYTVNLDETRSITVPAPNGGTNTVSIEPGRVCVSHASCPDQVCVRQGWVSQSAIPIVCLPNQLVIQIKGGESHLDAATG